MPQLSKKKVEEILRSWVTVNHYLRDNKPTEDQLHQLVTNELEGRCRPMVVRRLNQRLRADKARKANAELEKKIAKKVK